MAMHEWYNMASSARNEIVFQSRNKKYGAYQLRMEYNKTLTVIILSMISAVVTVVLIKYLIDTLYPVNEVEKNVKMVELNITPPIDKPNTEQPLPPEKTKEIPQKVMKTIQFIPPVIIDTTDNNNFVSHEKLNTSNVGTTNNKGDTTNINLSIANTSGKDGAIKGLVNNTPYTIVSEMPEFPGGTEEMAKFIQKNIIYPQSAVDKRVSGTCYLRFIVHQDGSISDIEVLKGIPFCPECDQEVVRIIKSMPVWAPGKQNGHPVSVYIQLPIKFSIR